MLYKNEFSYWFILSLKCTGVFWGLCTADQVIYVFILFLLLLLCIKLQTVILSYHEEYSFITLQEFFLKIYWQSGWDQLLVGKKANSDVKSKLTMLWLKSVLMHEQTGNNKRDWLMRNGYVLVKMYTQHPVNTNTVETIYSGHGYRDQPLTWIKKLGT